MTRSFLDSPAPEFGPHLVRTIMDRYPSVFLIVMRSKNQNVMIYEANIINGKFDTNHPVDIYWLNLEPSYLQARRGRGIHHDREELNLIERKLVWDATCQVVNDREIKFHLNIEPHPMRVKLSTCGTKANLFTVWKGEGFMIRSCFVGATENLALLNLKDNLKELTFCAIDMSTKKPRSVTIKSR